MELKHAVMVLAGVAVIHELTIAHNARVLNQTVAIVNQKLNEHQAAIHDLMNRR